MDKAVAVKQFDVFYHTINKAATIVQELHGE